MPSVLTLTAFLLREEGGRGKLIREGVLIKNFNLQMGGLLEKGGLNYNIRTFTVNACLKRFVLARDKV